VSCKKRYQKLFNCNFYTYMSICIKIGSKMSKLAILQAF
jgi:ABC-type multidrug transport system permease subunit